MNFIITHVYREDNKCVNDLVKLRLALDVLTIWNLCLVLLESIF